MWSTAFDPIKFDWFYLDRLRRSSPPLQAGITAEDRLWVKRRSSHEPNQMHNRVDVRDSLDLGFAIYFRGQLKFGWIKFDVWLNRRT